MCLAVFAIDAHPDWPLIVVANRDEFHARPTEAMQPWSDAPTVLAGRDLQAGGTWLGIGASGRLALLTNVRDPQNNKAHAPSRGQLAEGFLRGEQSAHDYLANLASQADRFNGFNLVMVDASQCAWHASNHQEPFARPITAGVHGLSNALLNTPWPKTARTTRALAQLLAVTTAFNPGALCEILHDTTQAPDHLLPQTGISIPRERLLSSPFIVSPDYGTRCTTLVLRHRSGAYWVQEDTYSPDGQRTQRVRWQLIPGQAWQSTQREPGNLMTDGPAIT